MQFTKKISNLFFLLTFSVIMNGCSNQLPAKRSIYLTEKKYSALSLSLQEEKSIKKSGVLVKIHKAVDNRPCQSNIGFFSGSEIIINDLKSWINSYFAILENSVKPSNNQHEILLDLYIKKLYLQNIHTSKAVTIVLVVNYLYDNQIIFSKNYRKQLVALNWNASEDEIAAILNKALNKIRNSVIEDLKNLSIPST